MSHKDKPALWIAWAIVVGIAAGTLGIGGGIIMVPVLIVALKFKTQHAVGTSLGIVIFTSIGGALGYITNGLNVPGLPAYSLGYVHVPSWLMLTVGGVGMAQVGAMTAHRLPARKLTYVFVAVMFYLGLKMLGVFDLLGLPM